MRAWDLFLAQQEKELGVEIVAQWLRPLRVVDFDARNLYLEASDPFQISWFEEHARGKVERLLLSDNQKKIRLHLTLATVSTATPLSIPREQSDSFFRSESLDTWATLDNYAVSDENRVPVEFLKGWLTDFFPNPIYLYGAKGVGKTHLLMAIAQTFAVQGKAFLYVHANTFTDHVVTAIRKGRMEEFRAAYRKADILLIDEIQDLSGRSATQEELFHTFNALHLDKKPIVFAGSLLPQNMEGIEPRLVSRIEWGITLHLLPPSEQTLLTMLRLRATHLKFTLPDSVVAFLIQTFSKSAEGLLRALETAILRSHLRNLPLTGPASAQTLLQDLVEEEKKEKLTANKIVDLVAHYYGLKPTDLLGKSQMREVMIPRQLAMMLSRRHLGLPYTKIGALFTRDHSTVMSSIRAIEKREEEKESELLSAITEITKRFE
jgi:chromosomal replication initiator protein